MPFGRWRYDCGSGIPDRLPLTRRAPCQSGLWAKVYKVSTPTLRYGGWGNIISNGYPDASFAACAADEIVVGGGGECSNPTRFWLHDSRPANMNNIDGWYANCFGRSEQNWQSADDTPALAYAICLKKQ